MIEKVCLFIAAAAAVISVEANAQTKQGHDALGLAMYCKEYLAAPKLPALSTLLGTFGDPLPCVEQRIAQGGLELVQVDLRDATCFRNKVCPAGTPALTDWRELLQRARSVNKLAVKYPKLEWWISPWLEHDIKDAALVKKACEVATKGCPTCKCINSPFTGARPAGIPVELHGTKVRSFAVSGDGASMFDGDNISSDGNGFEHRVSGERQTYAWFPELNLRCTGEKKFTPPLKRTEKPSAELLRQAALVMAKEQPVPPAPKQCTKVIRVDAKRGELIKPNAESYCNGQPRDPRGNKPLLILTKSGKRGDRMKVLNSKGKEVGCFAYWGTFETAGTHRWYMGSCSGQTPVGLYDALGGEWGFTELGGGTCLLTNAIRRMGVYR